MIQRGGLGNHNGIAAAAVALTDAIHDYKNNRFFHDELPPKRVCSHNFALYLILLFYIIFCKLTTYFLIFPLLTKNPPEKCEKQ
jgi:hypothetical protein